MSDNSALIHQLYKAFQEKDYRGMASVYHPEARFRDGAFDLTSGKEIGAMWEMLVTKGRDLRIEYRDVEAGADRGSAHWEAWYLFSATGKRVHNVIEAQFEFKDGLIYRHVDTFNFWRWSRQALGISGWLLGWSGFLQQKVRKGAMQNLRAFMSKAG